MYHLEIIKFEWTILWIPQTMSFQFQLHFKQGGDKFLFLESDRWPEEVKILL